LEHANKTSTGVDGYAGDISAMKAAGKCNADQVGYAEMTFFNIYKVWESYKVATATFNNKGV